MGRGKLQLYHWIIIGMVLGILTGILVQMMATFVQRWAPPEAGLFPPWVYGLIQLMKAAITQLMAICGQVFMRMLQMIIIPLVVGSIIVGTAGLGDLRRLGRLGVRTMVYYTATTAVAVVIGLLWANTVQPGRFITAEARTQLMATVADNGAQKTVTPPRLSDILVGLVPRNPFKAAVDGDMLPLIVFSLLFGVGITVIAPPKARFMTDFFDGITDVSVALVELIMKTAPIGVWGLMGLVVARTGLAVLKPLLVFSLVVLGGLLTQVLVVYTLSLRLLSRERVGGFFKRITEPLLVAFSTSSSSATLPVSMRVAEKELGIPERIAGFVLPLGATINMDGTALYQGIVTVFLAQLFGHALGPGQQVMIVLTATLASIGAAGVPSAGIITLLVVLRSVGMSPEGIAIILGVDRLLDMCRTMVNVTGDLVATRYMYAAELAVGDAELISRDT